MTRTRLTLALLATLAPLTACNSSSSSDASPRVTAPSEDAVVGGLQEIRWKNFKGDDVSIELSTDGGTTFPTVLAADTDNDGRFEFDTSAHVDGTTYRVRVTAKGKSARSKTFAIDNTAPVVALTSFDAGEIAGRSSTISWTTTDAHPGTVEIRLSSDSGASFPTVIIADAPDSGSFEWDPSGLADGINYRVQVTATDLAENVGLPDASAVDFEVDVTAPVVLLTAPNGGESWSGTQAITWTTTDVNTSTVDIFASVDGGTTFGMLIAEDVPDTGTYAFQTGQLPDGTTYRIRVIATDGGGNESIPAESVGDFSAQNLRLTGAAHYRDANGNATIDAGDEVYLRFDKDLAVTSATAADFVLPVSGDSFGTGPTIANGPETNALLITLGTNPTLRVSGLFAADDVAAGAPSGLELADPISADSIESLIGGIDASPTGPVDVLPQPTSLAELAGPMTTPRRAAAGDLDGDGDLDLVIAVTDGDASEQWTGDGDQGWVLSATFDTDDTLDVALGDLDGDGDLDVVTACNGPNRVWLNDGSGLLTDSTQALGTSDSRGVALADFDRDGDLDAFFGNGTNQANRLWRNDGTGVFAPAAGGFGSATTVAVATGDLDGDGDVDVYAANEDAESRVWVNTGTTFTAGGTTMATFARDVALGDLDRDGDLDVFLAVLGQNQISLNDGTGSFADPPEFIQNNDNRGVIVLDLDGDGDLDAMTAKNLDSGKYFLNNGDGTFIEDSVDSEAASAVDVVAGHFDGDGDVDFIVIAEGGAHRPYRGSAAGGHPGATYTAAARTEGPWQSGEASVGDIDGDGDLDLIVPDVLGATNVLLSDGAVDYVEGTAFGSANARGGDLFDADGDGDLDYLQRIGDPGTNADALWLGDGAGGFIDAGLPLGADTFYAGDLDGDGDGDLIVVTASDVETWDGDGAGGFAASGQTVANAGVSAIAFADIDRDGDTDVIAATATDVDILRNDGTGNFTVAASIAEAGVTALASADLDRDGDADVLVATSGAGNVNWFENTGALTFAAAATSHASTAGYAQLALVDFNEDGALDLFAVDDSGGALLVAAGNGDGTFQAGTATPSAAIASIAIVDADRDGDPDVYASRGVGAAASDELNMLD